MRTSARQLLHSTIIAVISLQAAAECGAQTHLVRPVDWSKYEAIKGVKADDEFGKLASVVLNNQSRYLFRWIESQYPLEKQSAGREELPFYSPDLENTYEGRVRPLAQFAWGNAVLVRTGIFDPVAAGITEAEALRRTEWAIRGVALTHCAKKADGYRWGRGLSGRQAWQAAYWAAQAAEAAWMLWDDLSAETKDAVAKMVESEANSFIDYRVPYWQSRSGRINTPGDSKAEENAWNSRLVTLAQAMMPEHPNVEQWRRKASELMISAYARPSDFDNATVVDGKPVKEWLNGCNTFEDGILVNHRIAHPGYTTAHTATYSTLIDASFAGQCIPPSALFNAQVTWDAITKLRFVPGEEPHGTGKNAPPGGTVFHAKPDGTADPHPYFPHGDDWAAVPEADVDYVLFAVYGTILGLDAGQSLRGIDVATAQVNVLRALQTRPNHDGDLYQDGDWTSAQEVIEVVTYQDVAEAWLVWWLHQNGKIAPKGDNWATVAPALERVQVR
jgi:hypothetical protein